jgi:GT2 family glycosyltransferase
LSSLRGQTYEPIEIVVVDDGSSCDVGRIARLHATDVLVRTTHLGPARAFNRGFLRGTGQFVIFCDDDLELNPRMMEKLVDALAKNPSKAYAYCGFVSVEDNDQSVKGMHEFDPHRLIQGNYISGTSLIRRSKFIAAGMFDPQIPRLIDWDLWLSLLERGEEGVLVPAILFRHFRTQGPKVSDDKNHPYERAYRLVHQKHPVLLGLARRIRPVPGQRSSEMLLAIDALLRLYTARSDLQSAFPETARGDYSRLLRWARDYLATGRDGSSEALIDYAELYRDNEWVKLVDEFQTLETERAKLADELKLTRTDRLSLVAQLDEVKRELWEIQHSFGYKVMRFYGARIDRLLPEGTSRGVLRRILVASLRVLTEQGVGSLTRHAIAKIKRREFRIIEPLSDRPPSAGVRVRTCQRSDEKLFVDLKDFLSVPSSRLSIPSYENPVVSIIVVTYNNAHYTYGCLCSLLKDTLPPYEIVIVDNASTDETDTLLGKTLNLKVIRNKRNEFFARACNQGAEVAKGKYLLFLNNDAFVHQNCVRSLVDTVDSTCDVGAAGAKLVLRDGRLQEAGSIIWRDGSALAYGRGDDPSKPEYSYRRDVDYCSAACLMVRRDTFESLRGFDESFTPAYYEDTDLCMRLWAAGLRVVYQPKAVATHVEFAGSSLEKATELMRRQQLMFVAKHREALDHQLPFAKANVLRARERKRSPSILVIDDCVPKPAEGSGYPRMFNILKSMACLGYRVTLLPSTDPAAKQPETEILTQMGVEVLWGDIRAKELLEDRRDAYDIALISRPHNALVAMNLVRETNPRARLIYDAEALWYRREQLRRRLGFAPSDPRFECEEGELSIMKSADYVVSVSSAEKELIEQRLAQTGKVILLGHPHPVSPTKTPFEERRDLLFVGGFKSSLGPNDDAAIHFAKTVFPRIQHKIPGIRFIIAGSNVPQSVKRLASDSVLVIGYVEDLKQLYESGRVFVAPIRFGAGTMWKVTEAMSYALPCVLSTVAAEGVEITDGEEALIANDEHDFVEKTIRLYQEKALWTRIRERELQYVAENCDPLVWERNLGQFLNRVSQSAAFQQGS